MVLVPVVGVGASGPDDQAWAKVGAELRALYAASQAARESGRSLRPSDPGIRLVEDRVIVDAVASASIDELRRDLVALGMRETATAGRIVSGQLPIAALPAVAALPSLRFVRAAVTAPHGAAGRGVDVR
jgi:hypothetical protein